MLAAYDAGLVIVDCSNPVQPKVVGQALLDSIDPYAFAGIDPLNKAVTIALSDKIAFLGVNNINDPSTSGVAMIYGFDYTQPAPPRLIQLGAYGTYVNDAVYVLRSNGTRLFAGLGLSLIEFDATQPRNTINLDFLPAAPRGAYETGARSSASRIGRQKRLHPADQGVYLWHPDLQPPPQRKYLH